MKQTKELSVRAGINNIARREGTNKMDPVFYSVKAPHNQPFGLWQLSLSKEPCAGS